MEGQTRAMLLVPGEAGEEPQPYPMSTNVLTTNLAGTGTMLFFRFQFALPPGLIIYSELGAI